MSALPATLSPLPSRSASQADWLTGRAGANNALLCGFVPLCEYDFFETWRLNVLIILRQFGFTDDEIKELLRNSC